MYTPIIGLEIHVQLKTKSKVFCNCSTSEADPNTNVCPICLGYPGAMPNLNKEAVLQSIRMGIALNCKISNETSWDRKSYMYPDLFKGYQISQLDYPIRGEGEVNIIVRDRNNYYSKDKYSKNIGIIRAHLEEDTAKSIHDGNKTLLDGNKSGFPLLEIVSAPDIHSVDEAVSYAKYIRNIARWFNISDCNLELGQMRFDANISILLDDIEVEGKKFNEWKGANHTPIVEIKNLNSFRNLQDALEYEIKRQIRQYEDTKEIYTHGSKETRGWDDKKCETYLQRKKEEAEDYRFTPEPDIPVLVIDQKEIEEIEKKMKIHPDKVRKELIDIGVNENTADILAEENLFFGIYESINSNLSSEMKVKLANIIVNDIGNEINEIQESDINLWLDGFNSLFKALSENKISGNQFKQILSRHEKSKSDWVGLLSEHLEGESEEINLEEILKKSFVDNPGVVEQIKSGKDSAKMFFVGIVMKETKGKANPNEVKKVIDKLL